MDREEQICKHILGHAKMLTEYAYFVDVVNFDTTFGTNKESRPFRVFVGFNHFRVTMVFVLFSCMMRHLSPSSGYLRPFGVHIMASNLKQSILFKILQWEK